MSEGCDSLHLILDNISTRFGSYLYNQIVFITMGTKLAPFVADLFFYEETLDDVQLYFKISKWLTDFLYSLFWTNIKSVYPTELQGNKANSFKTEVFFLNLALSITNGIVSSIIYNNGDDLNFDIVTFPFLDVDFLALLLGVYICCSLFVLQQYDQM